MKKIGGIIVVLIIIFLISPAFLYQDILSIIAIPLYIISLIIIFQNIKSKGIFLNNNNLITKSVYSALRIFGIIFTVLLPIFYFMNSSCFIDQICELARSFPNELSESIRGVSLISFPIFFIFLILFLVRNYRKQNIS
jgi:hypothetical protein